MISDKKALRKKVLETRRSLSTGQRSKASLAIQKRFLGYLAHHGSITDVLLYHSMDDEVDTHSLFSCLSHNLFAPVTHVSGQMQWYKVTPATHWGKGCLGVEEPDGGSLWTPACGTSMLVCPMAGFDRQGNRLGLGLGCFDRWLAGFSCYLQSTVGFAFACQEVPHIPSDRHDIPMHTIITESEIIQCRT